MFVHLPKTGISKKYFYIFIQKKTLRKVAGQKTSVILYFWSNFIFSYFIILFSMLNWLLFFILRKIFISVATIFLVFVFFLLQKELDTFNKLFWSLPLFFWKHLADESLDISVYEKKIIEKIDVKKWF